MARQLAQRDVILKWRTADPYGSSRAFRMPTPPVTCSEGSAPGYGNAHVACRVRQAHRVTGTRIWDLGGGP